MEKLDPEVEYGNKEYKRFFNNLNKKKIFSLTAQMNWRLTEGGGVCFYYIGINDDGSIYSNLTHENYRYSIKIIKEMTEYCDAKICEVNNVNNYFIVTIKKKWMIKNIKEYRILLLGDTNTYKTTFLAKLIKGKDNKKYIVNHKHELESGDTSSMNYYVLEETDNKYLLFDTPGNKKYIKTLLKMIDSISYNLVIFFSGKEWNYYNEFYNFFKNNGINILNIKDIGYNIKKNNFINLINKNVIENKNKSKLVKFNVLQTFHNNEIGILLSGFLESGTIKINDNLKWHNREKHDISVISIHGSNNFDNNNISLKKIQGPCIATICVKMNEVNFNKKIKYGYIKSN